VGDDGLDLGDGDRECSSTARVRCGLGRVTHPAGEDACFGLVEREQDRLPVRFARFDGSSKPAQGARTRSGKVVVGGEAELASAAPRS